MIIYISQWAQMSQQCTSVRQKIGKILRKIQKTSQTSVSQSWFPFGLLFSSSSFPAPAPSSPCPPRSRWSARKAHPSPANIRRWWWDRLWVLKVEICARLRMIQLFELHYGLSGYSLMSFLGALVQISNPHTDKRLFLLKKLWTPHPFFVSF